MNVTPLYDLTIRRVICLLKSGYWRWVKENPFSVLPSKIVGDLIDFILRKLDYLDLHLNDWALIIKSGKLRRVVLTFSFVVRIWNFLLRFFTREVCENLKYLKVLDPVQELETILEHCVNLEEFCGETETVPDLDMFRNCRNMRILKLRHVYQVWDCLNFPQSLRNLEVFSFCDFYDPEGIDVLVAKLLENCPNLISVGSTNVSKALAHIGNINDDPHPTFNLRRCRWYPKEDERDKKHLLLCDRMVYFVSRFPLLSELFITVEYEGIVQVLNLCKCLTDLTIRITHPSVTILDEFLSLLEEIGPQLTFLNIYVQELNIPVDVILERCPNLGKLFIKGSVSRLDRNRPFSRKFHPLMKLAMFTCDQDALTFILYKCTNLKVLLILNVICVNDDFLRRCLEQNCLSQLEEVVITGTSISPECYDLLLRTAVSAKSVHITNTQEISPITFRAIYAILNHFITKLFKDSKF